MPVGNSSSQNAAVFYSDSINNLKDYIRNMLKSQQSIDPSSGLQGLIDACNNSLHKLNLVLNQITKPDAFFNPLVQVIDVDNIPTADSVNKDANSTHEEKPSSFILAAISVAFSAVIGQIFKTFALPLIDIHNQFFEQVSIAILQTLMAMLTGCFLPSFINPSSITPGIYSSIFTTTLNLIIFILLPDTNLSESVKKNISFLFSSITSLGTIGINYLFGKAKGEIKVREPCKCDINAPFIIKYLLLFIGNLSNKILKDDLDNNPINQVIKVFVCSIVTVITTMSAPFVKGYKRIFENKNNIIRNLLIINGLEESGKPGFTEKQMNEMKEICLTYLSKLKEKYGEHFTPDKISIAEINELIEGLLNIGNNSANEESTTNTSLDHVVIDMGKTKINTTIKTQPEPEPKPKPKPDYFVIDMSGIENKGNVETSTLGFWNIKNSSNTQITHL